MTTPYHLTMVLLPVEGGSRKGNPTYTALSLCRQPTLLPSKLAMEKFLASSSY
jgi:hypothetical protein